MTISNASRRSSVYVGNGSTVLYSFAFKVFAVTDVVAHLRTSAGVLSSATHGAGCTVVLNADQDVTPGGSVVLDAVPAVGTKILILDATQAIQPVNLIFGDGFSPQSVEDSIDRAVMVAGQAIDLASRGLIVGPTESVTALPAAELRASKYLGFDASGNPIALDAPAGTTAVSVFAATMLDDTSAEAVRRTILVQQDSRRIAASTGTLVAGDYGRHVMVNQTCALAVGSDTQINGWWCDVTNDAPTGTGIVTIDPAVGNIGVAVGNAAIRIYPGETVRVRFDSDSYYRATGLSQSVLLNDVAFAGVSAQPVLFGVNSADFESIDVTVDDLTVSTTAGLTLQASSDGGSSYISTGYQHSRVLGNSSGTAAAAGSTSDTAISFGTGILTTNPVSGVVRVFGAKLNKVEARLQFAALHLGITAQGQVATTPAINGVRFLPSTGTISGRLFVRGHRGKF